MKISSEFKKIFSNRFAGVTEIGRFFGVGNSVIRKIIDENDTVQSVKLGYGVRVEVRSFIEHLKENENKPRKKCARKKAVKLKPLLRKKPKTKEQRIEDGEIVYKNLR